MTSGGGTAVSVSMVTTDFAAAIVWRNYDLNEVGIQISSKWAYLKKKN